MDILYILDLNNIQKVGRLSRLTGSATLQAYLHGVQKAVWIQSVEELGSGPEEAVAACTCTYSVSPSVEPLCKPLCKPLCTAPL